jgi:hypothetical protein
LATQRDQIVDDHGRADMTLDPDWQPALSPPPAGRDVKLAVVDEDGVHALVFPCRWINDRWVESKTGLWISVQPTHWRIWR